MPALEKLDADRILATSQRLERRIAERFPQAGLGRVCGQLVELAGRAKQTTLWIRKPNAKLRALSVGVIGTILVVSLIIVVASVGSNSGPHDLGDVVQSLEAAMNGLVLLGAAIWFFVSIETRFKRARVLKALHELRTLAHLIDVHQLTKDPDVIGGPDAHPTASSPERTLTPWQVGRYLDYCTEMLSLTGKIAALYSDGFGDPEAVDAVTDLEALTNALQHKLWQKIVLLESRSGVARPTVVAPSAGSNA
jgi:hypothetical protein